VIGPDLGHPDTSGRRPVRSNLVVVTEGRGRESALREQEGLDRLLSGFTVGTPGVLHALLVTVDGLARARSDGLGQDTADTLAAAACGLVSLAAGAAGTVGLGPLCQTIVELGEGHLFLAGVGTGDTLLVVARRGCEMGRVGYEMALLGGRIGATPTGPVTAPSPLIAADG
jgi:predicted regulator of Ras-like GTPase activity (Roadblock/LC7/MglB family)